MKIGILDDERSTAELLCEFVTEYLGKKNIRGDVRTFGDAKELLSAFDNSYDMLLLDIEMPGMNGMEAAHEIRKTNGSVVIVFVTNMTQYAIEGYEVDAADYILKPLDYFEFALKFEKAIGKIYTIRDKNISLKTDSGTAVVKISSLQYVEVLRNYLYYHTDSGELRVRGTMKNAEAELSGCDFSRINNGYLVNMRRITNINGYTVVLDGNTELIISRGRKADFMQEYLKFTGRI